MAGSDLAEPDRSISRLADALRQHTGNGCFACGLDNPIGLHVDNFRYEADQVVASFVPRSSLQGTVGNLHGGISATALDEIMVWAGILQEGVLSVTGKMELRYHRPVGVSDEIELRGRVEERRGSRLRIIGTLGVRDQPVAVSGKGLYLVSHQMADLIAEASR